MLTILGCNSAVPTTSRFTTSQVLQNGHKSYIIDCGEGAQIRLNEYKIKKTKIHEIFISHLHGDHFFGLPGIITSMNLAGRENPLTIYGPIGLKKYLNILKDIGSFYLNFELYINELEPSGFNKIFEDKYLEVFSFPLKHRIPTTGFLFKYDLTYEEIKNLKHGNNITSKDGTLLKYLETTTQEKQAESYAFCSDTIYDEELVTYIKGVDLLYHEATYLDDLKDKARERGHATAKEAALIAKKSEAGKLILGHFSSRYKDLSVFIKEAEIIFPCVQLAEDGKVFRALEQNKSPKS
ncbi:UNVERIFIED_CONTAM: hypothetical protein GTU68_052361 [Idotea baltica]|nr:hypothetical protein [Idotea baltica]